MLQSKSGPKSKASKGGTISTKEGKTANASELITSLVSRYILRLDYNH